MSKKEEGLVFDTTLKKVPVTLIKDNGEKEKCELRELTGNARDKHISKFIDRAEFDEKGNFVRFKSFDGMTVGLLSLSLFHNDGKPFTVEELDKLPSSVLKQLYNKAQEISGLTQEAADTAKKD